MCRQEGLDVSCSIERTLGEPSTELSVVGDTTSYSVTVSYQATKKFSLAATGQYERIEEIGDTYLFRERSLDFKVKYTPREDVELFANLYGKKVNEDFTGDDYDQVQIGVGGAISF